MDTTGPRRGTRDNGLSCGNYAIVGDLDPRVVGEILTALRSEGIAAYAEPAPGATGGYMETRLPSRPLDRLWVDDQQVARARAMVAESSRPESAEDFEAAWQQVLASLQSPSAPVGRWPSEGSDEPADAAVEDVFAAEEHFEPPPPPPLPRLRPVTLLSIALIAVGLLVLATGFDGGSLTLLAIAAVLGGFASLVWHMRQGPPPDSGWDDGAVV